MIYTEILFLSDKFVIQDNTMLHLVITVQQYYNVRTYPNYSFTLCINPCFLFAQIHDYP